jgi:hypothetical protein
METKEIENSEVQNLLDILDNYVPDSSLVNQDNSSDYIIDPSDFASDLTDKNIESYVTVTSEAINVENTDIVDDSDQNTIQITDNTEVVESVTELQETTENVVDLIEEGNKEQSTLLNSIDDTLKDQFEAQERDRRKAAIINETTPFDHFVNAQNTRDADVNQNNGGGLLGGLIPPFGGGAKDRKDKDKKWKDKTKGEKFKTGLATTGKYAAIATLLGLVGLTAKDKLFPEGMPDWMPFVGEDEDGNSDSPISDAVATVGLAGAGYYGAKKAGQAVFGNDVKISDVDSKVDVNDLDPDSKNTKAISDNTKDLDTDKNKSSWFKSLGKKFSDSPEDIDPKDSKFKFSGKGMAAITVLASGINAYQQVSEINKDEDLTEEDKNKKIANLAGTTAVDTTAQLAGGLAGAKAGAALGATIGTLVFPGIGTAVGGAIGGIAGSIGGSMAGSMIMDTLGFTEAGGEVATAAYETVADISDTASKMYDNAEKIYVDTVESGKKLADAATTSISKYVSGLFSYTDSTASSIKNNTDESANLITESTAYFNTKTGELLNPESKNANSIGQTVSLMSQWPMMFAPILGLVGTDMQKLFGEFGSTITDSINTLTEELGELGDLLWDNLVNVFEGDDETDRALEDAKKKFNGNSSDQETGFFKNLFGNNKPKNNIIVVPNSSSGNVPAPKVPNYRPNSFKSPEIKSDIMDSGMNVQAVDNVQVVPMETQSPFKETVNNYYGSNSVKPKADKPVMKMVPRREMKKAENNGISFAAPSLDNTPNTVQDATLGLLNIGVL